MVLESTCKKKLHPSCGAGVSSQHCHWKNPNKPLQVEVGLNHPLITPQSDNALRDRAGLDLAPWGSGASAQDPMAAPGQAPLPTARSFLGMIGTTSFSLSIQARLGKQLVWCPCDSAAFWCHAGTLWDQLPSAPSPFVAHPSLPSSLLLSSCPKHLGPKAKSR